MFVELEEEILRKTGMRPRHRIPPVRKQSTVSLANQKAEICKLSQPESRDQKFQPIRKQMLERSTNSQAGHGKLGRGGDTSQYRHEATSQDSPVRK
jgi:hypothetical protein